jgi:nucleoside-diphosphate-sugar epimerase
MRALVGQGAGFIGSRLVNALVARGDGVTEVENLSRGRELVLSCTAGENDGETDLLTHESHETSS